MTVNPDPRPGRWVLPLVILGMVAFTYFFVSALPEASPDTTLAAATPTTTTTTSSPGTTQGLTEPEPTLDPEAQAYLDAVDAINGELQLLRTEMITINAGFDAEPREIEYAEAEAAFEALADDTQALSERLDTLTVPTELQVNHDFLTTTIRLAVVAANDALAGLRSTDTGEQRRAAAESYTTAADDFDTEVGNAHDAAEAAAADA